MTAITVLPSSRIQPVSAPNSSEATADVAPLGHNGRGIRYCYRTGAAQRYRPPRTARIL